MHMRLIKLKDYNAIRRLYRGVWTTEREDWPNWSEVRELYMGKRTLLVQHCEVLVEGLHFAIIG